MNRIAGETVEEYIQATSYSMSLSLALLALVQALGFCALLVCIRQAPEGYEDEVSFYYA